MVMPGSCCPFQGLVPLLQAAAGSRSGAAAGLSPQPLRPGAPSRRRPSPPVRFQPLFGLGLLHTGLGCVLVVLSFRALSLSSAPQVKNACPIWAGSSAILYGIFGLATWKRPILLWVNLLVLLSTISVMLNAAGLILGCQGIQFVTRAPSCDLMDVDESKTCLCCEELHSTTCTEAEAVLKLYHVKSCSAAHLFLKKVVLALSVLSALTAAVSFIAAALHCFQILASRRSCMDECESEDEHHNLGPDDFVSPVPPVPPPSYFAALNPCTQQTSRSMPVSHVVSLSYICGMQIKSVEVFYRLDPPPPYETVCSLETSEQGSEPQINSMEDVDSGEVSDRQSYQGDDTCPARHIIESP